MLIGGDEPGVVVYRNPVEADGIDAIDAYSRRLVDALCTVGGPATYANSGLAALLAGSGHAPGWIVLQYNPFSYGTWGFAPALVRDVIRVRRRWPRTRLVLSVHEAWVSACDWRSALMGTYQRAQLQLLLRLIDRVIVVRETLAHELGRPCTHVPVGSNILPVAVAREDARARLGLAGQVVVALFGRRNPSRALTHAHAAIAALASQHGPDGVYVFNLGSDSPIPVVPPGVTIESPGALCDYDLSIRLIASDVLLLPFTDGLSTRRGTLMAGLAHGLPVVGLVGFNTDSVLVDNAQAMVLSPSPDAEAYARATIQLTRDPLAMREVGRAARRLYARNFDWSVIARTVLTVVFGGGESPKSRQGRAS